MEDRETSNRASRTLLTGDAKYQLTKTAAAEHANHGPKWLSPTVLSDTPDSLPCHIHSLAHALARQQDHVLPQSSQTCVCFACK